MAKMLAAATCIAGLLLACGDDSGPGKADAALDASTADATTGTQWAVHMRYGYEGSPTVCDLRHDGHLTAILPMASFFDERHPDVYLTALDAATGALRWQTPDGVGGFANPLCVPVDADGVDDVIVAGRSADVQALSGATGAVLWSMKDKNPGVLRASKIFSGGTYSSVVAAQAPDILFVTNGGGGAPEASQPDVPGQLIAYGRDGVILATWQEPDQGEFYSSPAIMRSASGELLVAVASGGERKQGTLRLLAYDPAQKSFTIRWGVPSACASGGFVSSPMFGDLTGDGVPEVVAVDFCGTVHTVALDGTPGWTFQSTVPYGTANPLLADVDGDHVLDVLAVFETLDFSLYETTQGDPHSDVVALSGKSGALLWRHRFDRLVFASPVSADRDHDGIEDVWLLGSGLMPVNAPPLVRVLSGRSGAIVADLQTGESAGTPVLGDFDGDGQLDLLLASFDRPPNGTILRIAFPGVPYTPSASWSGFRGAAHDGYRK